MTNIYLLCSITVKDLEYLKSLQVYDVDQYQYYVKCSVIRAFTNKKKCLMRCSEWNSLPCDFENSDKCDNLFYFCKTVSV